MSSVGTLGQRQSGELPAVLDGSQNGPVVTAVGVSVSGTIHPLDASNEKLVTTWVGAEADAFVALEDVR